MNKDSILKIDIKELARLKNLEEISSKSFYLEEVKNDKFEKLKYEYLKKIISNYNLKELKYDEEFLDLILHLINKENKDTNDLHILVTYLVYLDEVVDMLKSSSDNILEILKLISSNLKLEIIEKNKLVFRQGLIY